MNILLINHYAGSPEMGMEFRPYYFAKEWTAHGHHVDIIAADFSHIRRVNPKIEYDLQSEDIDSITYHWVHTGHYDGNGAKRALTMAKFVGYLWVKAHWIVRNLEPDVAICSSTYPLDTYVGQRIKRISPKPVKLIHEVHDMWPISPVELGGMSPKHPFIRAMQMGENSFCKHADVVVSLLPAAKDYFVEHGMEPEKFRHVANGVVLSEWENYEPIPVELAQHFLRNKAEGKFNLCFFGSLHKTYNLETLIRAVKQMGRKDLALTLIGPGHDRQELEALAGDCGNIIRFFDPIPKKTIPDLFHYIDASFIGVQNSTICRFGICMNKLFDSMMGGKPIVYMVDAPYNYVEKYECGITVEGNDEKSLAESITRLLKTTENVREQMGRNGVRAAVNEFNYGKLAEQFLTIMGPKECAVIK